MNQNSTIFKLSRVAFILFALQLAIQSNVSAQFTDDFNSSTLDPSWTVVQTWPGGIPRVYGFNYPGNHYSLTDNPGFLRYTLDPMTYHEGYLYSYATVPAWTYSCCPHDAGLELHRTFSGNHWLFEAKGIFYLPFTNGRYFVARIYFGNGDLPTYWVSINRGADVNQNYLRLSLLQKAGSGFNENTLIEDMQPGGNWYYGLNNYPFATLYYRIERNGGLLTASWSDDDVSWNSAWTHDLGDALDGLEQRVVLTGTSWFNPYGFADSDYISVESTILSVTIDIKPGSSSNPVAPNSNGVIPVAILTTEEFNASAVDPLTVKFGPNGAAAKDGKATMEDADGDGDLDMVLHFRTQETGIQCGETSATLTGNTISGQYITGTDAIKTTGCTYQKTVATEQPEYNSQAAFVLYPVYPNPFQSETQLRFTMARDNQVRVKIFDICGKEIKTLLNEYYPKGEHKIMWDGTDNYGNLVPGGFYVYHFEADTFTQTGKISIIR